MLRGLPRVTTKINCPGYVGARRAVPLLHYSFTLIPPITENPRSG